MTAASDLEYYMLLHSVSDGSHAAVNELLALHTMIPKRMF